MHTHDHHHELHHHHEHLQGNKLIGVTLLNAIITLAEVIGGLCSNSLSLLSDAIHNLGDTLSLIFATIAQHISKKQPNMRFTFGYKRAEILAALLNAMLLIFICFFLFKEAIERYLDPEPIKGLLMLTVAVIGLVANLLSVWLLEKDKHANINLRAAYLHLMGDTLSSVAVIIGGIAIWLWQVTWLDPLITIIVGVYILWHTWGVLRQAIDILMQSAPSNIDVPHIVADIVALPHVQNLHHLHLWQLNEAQVHFEAHIKVDATTTITDITETRQAIQQILLAHKIDHSTLQIDTNCCDGSKDIIVTESCIHNT